MKASVTKLAEMSVGSVEEENFVFLGRIFSFFRLEGKAYLKTLDVCLLVRFLNVLALWGGNPMVITRWSHPNGNNPLVVTQR